MTFLNFSEIMVLSLKTSGLESSLGSGFPVFTSWFICDSAFCFLCSYAPRLCLDVFLTASVNLTEAPVCAPSFVHLLFSGLLHF